MCMPLYWYTQVYYKPVRAHPPPGWENYQSRWNHYGPVHILSVYTPPSNSRAISPSSVDEV